MGHPVDSLFALEIIEYCHVLLINPSVAESGWGSKVIGNWFAFAQLCKEQTSLIINSFKAVKS